MRATSEQISAAPCVTIGDRPLHKSHRVYPPIEDMPPQGCKMAPVTWNLPLGAGVPNFAVQRLPFIPRAVTVRNYSNQSLYLKSGGGNSKADILNLPELIVPSRIVYNAPFGLSSWDKEFAWELPGSSYGQKAIIQAFFYDCLLFEGDDFYYLPPDLQANAFETYEKSTTILSGQTPGGTLASGSTDTYQLLHASVDLVVSADTSAMLFTTGTSASNITGTFTLYPGERESVGARVGFVSVKNIGAVTGGYRIQNLYVSQTL